MSDTIYVLDTDVGYDPDDLMAIWTFAKQFPSGHIITSAEIEVKMRARIVCKLVEDYDGIKVYSGEKGNAGSTPPGKFTGWAKSQFSCAYKGKYEQIVATCLRDNTTRYDGSIGTRVDLFQKMGDPNKKIVWIGIGAMTNLSSYLQTHTPTNIHVIQMGVCSKNAKKYSPTNIFLDPSAAASVNNWFKRPTFKTESSKSTLTYVGSDFTSKVPWLHGPDIHAAGYGKWIENGTHAQLVGGFKRWNVAVDPRVAFDKVYENALAFEAFEALGVERAQESDTSTPFEAFGVERAQESDTSTPFDVCREVWESNPTLKKCIIANIVSSENLGGEYFPPWGSVEKKHVLSEECRGVTIPKCGTCWPWNSNFHDILTVYIAKCIHDDGKDPEDLGCQRTDITLRDYDGALERWVLPDDTIFKLIPKDWVSCDGTDEKIQCMSGYNTDQIESIKASMCGLFDTEAITNHSQLCADLALQFGKREGFNGDDFKQECTIHAPWRDENKTAMVFDARLVKTSNTFITTKQWELDGDDMSECMKWIKELNVPHWDDTAVAVPPSYATAVAVRIGTLVEARNSLMAILREME